MGWRLKMAGMLIGLFGLVVAARWANVQLRKILDWFRNRSQLALRDKNNLSFTIKEEMAQGNYVVYQGIYNEASGELLDGQKVMAPQMDTDFANLHRDVPLVIYQ